MFKRMIKERYKNDPEKLKKFTREDLRRQHYKNMMNTNPKRFALHAAYYWINSFSLQPKFEPNDTYDQVLKNHMLPDMIVMLLKAYTPYKEKTLDETEIKRLFLEEKENKNAWVMTEEMFENWCKDHS